MILSHSRFAACKKARKNLSLYALGPQLGLKVDDVQNRKSNNVRIRVKYFLYSTFVRFLNWEKRMPKIRSSCNSKYWCHWFKLLNFSMRVPNLMNCRFYYHFHPILNFNYIIQILKVAVYCIFCNVLGHLNYLMIWPQLLWVPSITLYVCSTKKHFRYRNIQGIILLLRKVYLQK